MVRTREARMELSNWRGAPRPERVTLDGSYARLEPLSAERHGLDLFRSAREDGAEERFRYTFDDVPSDLATFQSWLQKAEVSEDPMFCAVIDRRTGTAHGRQALMKIDAANGVVEMGHVMWGPGMARSRISTEALYLTARYIFDALGYRRFEWKCNHLNNPSRNAAKRFGFSFEGIFRQHMVVKGQNRDTAWFAMTDADWVLLKPHYAAWLSPSNFDENGQQRTKLEMTVERSKG
jgi:RimJ/RimL family protein N-acetyltransferase